MEALPSYIVSDVHLGAVPSSTERSFRAFLRAITGRAAELLINGDLFDFWFEYRSVIQGEHYRVLAALADLREAGTRIRFIGGNHDAWVGPFLQGEVGLEVVREGSTIELGGRRALVVHGDGVGEGDLGYRILKKVIRHPISIHLFRMLHPDIGARIAGVVSKTESKQGTPAMANPARAAALREWALGELARRPEIDLVLAGHTHIPTIEAVGSDRFYVNTGDWINHRTYLYLPKGERPRLLSWPGDDAPA